jgi:hypothetical protein
MSCELSLLMYDCSLVAENVRQGNSERVPILSSITEDEASRSS